MSEAGKRAAIGAIDTWADLAEGSQKSSLRRALVVEGDLLLGAHMDMRRYRELVCVRGNLIIDNCSGTSIELPNLVTVEGNVVIQGNRCLRNLRGLDRLTYIGGDLVVRYNDALVSFDGLENVRRVGDLQVYGNGPVQEDHTLTSLIALAAYQMNAEDEPCEPVVVESDKHVKRATSDGTGVWEMQDRESRP